MRILKQYNSRAGEAAGLEFVGVHLPPLLDQRLILTALLNGESKSAFIRRLLEEWDQRALPIVQEVVEHLIIARAMHKHLSLKDFEIAIRNDLWTKNTLPALIDEIIEKFRSHEKEKTKRPNKRES